MSQSYKKIFKSQLNYLKSSAEQKLKKSSCFEKNPKSLVLLVIRHIGLLSRHRLITSRDEFGKVSSKICTWQVRCDSDRDLLPTCRIRFQQRTYDNKYFFLNLVFILKLNENEILGKRSHNLFLLFA